MAITVTDRGISSGTTSTSFNAATALTGTMAVGSTGILIVGMDNASAPTTNFSATSYTDSKGNVWILRAEQIGASALGAAELAILTSVLTSSLSSSDTLTINLTATAVKTWAFIEAAPGTAGNVVFYVTTTVTSTGATTTPSVTLQDATNGDLVVAAIASEGPDTFTGPDTDTTSGSWSATAQHTGLGVGAAGMSLSTQTKLVTDYSNQIYNLTVTSSDCAQLIAQFQEADPRIRTIGKFSNSQASSTVTITSPLTTGSIAVLCVAADNSGTSGSTANLPVTPTDTQSNTWVQQKTGINDPGTANQGTETSIYTSVLTHGLALTDTITLSYGTSVPAKCWVLYEFAPASSGSMTYVTGGIGTTGAGIAQTASPTITTSSIASGDYVVGLVGAEGLATGTLGFTIPGDADTTNGNWSIQTSIGTGGLGASMFLATQYKKVTAAGAQTYNPTYAQAADCLASWIEINDSSPTGGLTASQKAAFFQMF